MRITHKRAAYGSLAHQRVTACAVGVFSLVAASVVSAQTPADNYPSSPVTIIVPVSPGGSLDAESRLYGQKLTQSMGRSFVIDFKPGAGTTMGANYVAKAVPNGYTLLAVSTGFTVAPSFYSSLPYNSGKDIAPIMQMTFRPYVIVVHPDVPVKTPAEYIAYTRANPGKLNFGTTGMGGSLHLAGLWLDSITGGKATYVHYKGAGPALIDLVAGRIQVLAQTIRAVQPMSVSGKLRIVGVNTKQRSAVLPGVATFAEHGATDYDFGTWFGFATTGGTPVAIINKLHAELLKVGNEPDIRKRMEADGATLILGTPAEFSGLLKSEIERWTRLLKAENLKPEE